MPDSCINEVLQSGNASIRVTLYPRPQAETIILLHGGPGVPDDMTEVREFLTPKYQIINFEQRGTGQFVNQKCTFTLSEYIDDLETIRNHFGITKFHLFGHSWGGVYAQLYAMQHSENILSLFLCSPASGTGKTWTQAEHEIFWYNYHRSGRIEWACMAFNTFLGLLGNSKAYRRLFRQLILNYHKGYQVDPPDEEKLSRIGARAGTLTRKEIKRYPELPSFGTTSYPVIITYGEYDAYGSSRQQQLNRFPSAIRHIIPSSGHTPWKHNLPYFQSLLQEFYNYAVYTPPGCIDYVK